MIEKWIGSDALVWKHLLSSLMLVGSILLARALVVRRVTAAQDVAAEVRRRWLVRTRTLSLFLILLGLVFIWATELRTVALSVVALAVAIVIATKELILCLSGSLLKASSRPFTIGDRIEINGLRGDVIDQDLLTTTLLEIGPGQMTQQYTGRSITVPNGIFLTSTVIKESFTESYSLHAFPVPVRFYEDWRRAEELLLQAANEECAAYIPLARQHMENLGKSQGLNPPSVQPRVTLHIPDPETMQLVVRVPVPASGNARGRIEQAILRKFSSAWKPRSFSGAVHSGQPYASS